MRKRFASGMILWVLLACLSWPALAESEEYKLLNKGSEGQEFAVTEHLVKGKTNVIDFYSDYCPPCRAVAPILEKLAQKDPDVVVGKLDINRPGKRGIDWSSPLAQQYKLRSIPHFKIYDGEGKLVAEGQKAKEQVIELLKKNELQ